MVFKGLAAEGLVCRLVARFVGLAFARFAAQRIRDRLSSLWPSHESTPEAEIHTVCPSTCSLHFVGGCAPP